MPHPDSTVTLENEPKTASKPPKVGFVSLGSFSRLFAERVGVAPREWQRRVRAVLPSAELWPAVWIPACFLLLRAPSTFGEAPALR